MKKFTFFFLLIMTVYGLAAQNNLTVKISYVMNKTNPPSYTFSTDFTGEAVSYDWYFSDNASYKGATATHSFKYTGAYGVKVKITEQTGQVYTGALEARFEGETTPVIPPAILAGRGKVRKLSLDGCTWAIVLENGTTLLPLEIVPPFTLMEGQYVEIAYEILQNAATVCMAGKPARIHKIALLSAATSCKSYFTWSVNSNSTDKVSNTRTVSFTNKSTGMVKECVWTFGDETKSNELNPVHEYAKFGEFRVCLLIVTTDGCRSEYYATVRITDPSANPVLHKGTGYVKDKSAIAGCRFVIALDDGTVLEPVKIVPEFVLKEGQHVELLYEILLNTATTCQAGIAVKIHRISVIQEIPPVLYGKGYVRDKSAVDGCGLVILLDDRRMLIPVEVVPNFLLKEGQRVELAWEQLRVETTCMSGIPVRILKIAEIPAADVCRAYFTASNDMFANPLIMKTMVFSNQSAGEISECFWSFGDSTTSKEMRPVHEYKEFGEYKVCLTILTTTGCKSEYCAMVKLAAPALPVCPGAISLLLYDPSPVSVICDGKAVVALLDENGAEYESVKYSWSNGNSGNTAFSLCRDKTYMVQALVEGQCQKNSSFAFLSKPQWRVSANGDQFNFSVVSPVEDVVYRWDFGDGKSAFGPNADYSFASDGVYNVTLTAINGSYTSEASEEVTVMKSITPATIIGNRNFSLYPNPVKELLYIQQEGQASAGMVVEISDIKGQVVLRKVYPAGVEQVIALPVSQLPDGMYLLRMISGNRAIPLQKFVKQH